jgi:hypothetical protein
MRATSVTNIYIMNHHLHEIYIVPVDVDDIVTVPDSVEWIASAKRAIGR